MIQAKQWEVWMADYPYDFESIEEEHQRPVLILKVKDNYYVTVAMTTSDTSRNEPEDYLITDQNKANWYLDKPSVLRLGFKKDMINSRLNYRLGEISNEEKVKLLIWMKKHNIAV